VTEQPDRPASRRTALITGASRGIGRALAHIHAAQGGNVIAVARDSTALAELKEELEAIHQVRVTPIVCDLGAAGAAATLFREVEALGDDPDILINNAGFGGHGLFAQQAPGVQAGMMQVNMVALTELTRLIVPGMIGRRRGRIMNVASMAGFLPGPLQAVYYATKAYVLSLSEALANELTGTGVSVTALCPGPTSTAFQQTANLQGVTAFRRAASARDVAAYGYDAMERGEAVAIPGAMNRLAAGLLLRLTPRGLVTRLSRRTMEKHT
jgi:short-subunit dehydrogenase